MPSDLITGYLERCCTTLISVVENAKIQPDLRVAAASALCECSRARDIHAFSETFEGLLEMLDQKIPDPTPPADPDPE